MYDGCYFSADRLVEFGIGMAMARQMVQMFEKSMDAANKKAEPETEPVYYVEQLGKPIGPINKKELLRLIFFDKVDKDTLAWMPGMIAWQPIKDVPQILKLIALNPPELPSYEI